MRHVVLGLIVFLLFFSPLQYGGNRPWSIAAIQTVTALLALALTVLAVQDPRRFLDRLRPLGPALALAALALGWALLQTVSWTPVAWHHPIWALSADALELPYRGAIAVDPAGARVKAALLLAYVVVFLAAYVAAADTARARLLFWVCAACTGFYAAYGLVFYFLGILPPALPPASDRPPTLPQYAKVTGPFASANHFALYLVMGLACACVEFRRIINRLRLEGRWRIALVHFIDHLGGVGLPFLALVFLLLSAIFLGASRAGVLLAIGTLGLITLTYWFKQSRHGRPYLLAGTGIALTAVFMAAFQLGGGGVATELQDTLNDADPLSTRTYLWALARHMIADAPWLGSGLTSFFDLYPLYSDGAMPGFHFRRAHNDYLGLFVALGIPAGLCWIGALALLYWRCLKGVWLRSRRVHYVLAPAVVMTAVAAHSIVEFGLEIPANAIMLAVLLGVGCAQAGPSERQEARQRGL